MFKSTSFSRLALLVSGLVFSLQTHAVDGNGFKVGPLRVSPTAGLTLSHDSNVIISSEDEIDSFLLRFSPGVKVEAGSEFNRLSATLQSEFGRYQSSSLDNYTDHSIGLQWSWSPLVRHSLLVDGTWARHHDARGTAGREGELALLALAPDEYDQKSVGARYRFGAPGARGRLEFEAATNSMEYRNNRELTIFRDRNDRKLAGGFYWRIAPKTSALVTVDQIHADYDVSTLDSTERHYYVGVELDATARTSGSLLFGHAQKDFDDPARLDYSGTSWRASVNYKLRSYSMLELTTSRDADETNGFGDFILRRDVTLAWMHQWSSRLTSQIDVGVARDEHRPSLRTDRSTYYGLSGQYRLAPWLSLGAGYSASNRSTDISQLNYQRKQLLLSLEASL
ncbi:MAG: outer membrane beta-barrel protein [Pseudomonadota bacterium]|nr:outer membrane beta-barrel protein [Pseudomonadota bacterium]